MTGGTASGGSRLALAVLQCRPTLLLPAALALGTTIAVTTHYMARVDMGMFWIVEIIVLAFILGVAYVVGHAALTFARAFTVAATIHHLAGTDRPLVAATGQVGRRLGSVIPWVFMHTMVWLVFSVAMFMRQGQGMIVPVRFEPGASSLRNNQFVYQVMFGENAGLAKAMDRSATLVRVGLRGSQPFTFVATIVAILAGAAFMAAVMLHDFQTNLPWTLMVIAVTTALSLWTTMRDIIDTASWRASSASDPWGPTNLGSAALGSAGLGATDTGPMGPGPTTSTPWTNHSP